PTEFGSQVDPGDPAAVTAGEKPRRAANARADVEHPLTAAQTGELGQPDRRLPLAAMKLVYRSQIIRRQMGDVLSRLPQRAKDNVAEAFSGVMSLDRIPRQFLLLQASAAPPLLQIIQGKNRWLSPIRPLKSAIFLECSSPRYPHALSVGSK